MQDILKIRRLAEQYQIKCSTENLAAFVNELLSIAGEPGQSSWDGEIKPEDFLIETYRDQGGGFIVSPEKNIRLTHKPSGVVVHADTERSAHANKQKAWEEILLILRSKSAEQEGSDKNDDDIDALPDDAEMSVFSIGNVDVEDGKDWYYLVKRSDDILSDEQAKNWLFRRVYKDSDVPGSLYCTSISAMPKGSAGNTVICIAEVRRNW